MDEIWTHFWDMHSGGGSKEKWSHIYIEAPEREAMVIFYNRFGHNPHRVSCTCCGSDYSISEGTIDQITAYHRGCDFAYVSPSGNIVSEDDARSKGRTTYMKRGYKGQYVERASSDYRGEKGFIPLDEYMASNGDLSSFDESRIFIRAKDIKPSEREGDVPDQGYIWQD